MADASYAAVYAARARKRRRRHPCRRLLIVLVLLAAAVLFYRNPPSRWGTPQALRDMVERNPETADFAAGYPGAEYLDQPIDLSDDYVPGQTPLFLQWDSRWGYAPYGGDGPEDLIGLSGCGPTALSMVTVALTGDTSWNPKAVADYAVSAGYCTEHDGTAWALMTEGCEAMGLTAETLSTDETSMREALSSGRLLIASVGPGDFTTKGHFIVLCGFDGGAFSIRDPFSRKNSEQTWTYDRLSGQLVALWAFSAA